MNRPHVLAALALAALGFGCQGGDAPKTDGGATPTPATNDGRKALKVGVVFDSGGRGDKSFNDSAYAGVQRAVKELGIVEDDVKTVDSKSEKDYEGNLTSLAESGREVIFAVGLAQANALRKVAPNFPDVKFAIVDSQVEGPNVRSLVFNEEQGSYLAGYLAALVSQTGKIGFVGGKKIPLIEKFQAGYEAGARAANPKVAVLPAKYTESWDDVAIGKASAKALLDGGADVVYHAAGRCGLGVIDAAKEAGKYAIGVDSNQDDVAPGTVLTSMVKRVDEAVFSTLRDVQDGKFTAGTVRYDLAANGVGLTDFAHTKAKIGEANLARLAAAAEAVKGGKVKVPTTLAP